LVHGLQKVGHPWPIVKIIIIYLAMATKRFCDCCRNMGHFLCGVDV